MAMKYSVNDLVRLLEDREYPDASFPAGTIGVVTAVIETMAAYLVVLGHDTTTRLLPERVLGPVAAAATLDRSITTTTRNPKFSPGDRVKLKQARSYPDASVPAGALGTVLSTLPTFDACLVDFDRDPTDRIVPTALLTKAS